MPVEYQSVTAGQQFTGLPGAGFLESKKLPIGGARVVINSVNFTTDGGDTPTFQLLFEEPDGLAGDVLIVQATGNDAYLSQFVVPEKNGVSWPVKFITTGMTQSASLAIDYSIRRIDSHP